MNMNESIILDDYTEKKNLTGLAAEIADGDSDLEQYGINANDLINHINKIKEVNRYAI